MCVVICETSFGSYYLGTVYSFGLLDATHSWIYSSITLLWVHVELYAGYFIYESHCLLMVRIAAKMFRNFMASSLCLSPVT
uniref:Uncharacterized protein n=1 Tax=Arundo donax TaxID=35708 RepID=A0A0A9BI49_ARUDO